MKTPRAEPTAAAGAPPVLTGLSPLQKILHLEFGVAPSVVEDLLRLAPQAAAKPGDLRKLLLQQKTLPVDTIQGAVAKLYGLEYRPNLDDVQPKPEFAQKIPIRFAKKYGCFPMLLTDQELVLAVEDPEPWDAFRDIARAFDRRARLVVSTHSAVLSLINRAYDREHTAADQPMDEIREVEGDGGMAFGIEEPEDLLDAQDEEPIKRLLNNILYQAARINASDVHIDATPGEVVVRFRVDGVLHTATSLPKSIQRTLINRVKIMSRLDIAQHSLPQDGRTLILIAGRKIDIRVSIMPTIHGEKAVMRLLFQDVELFDLTHLGMPDSIRKTMLELIQSSGGIVLVSGPTGSGKTTTLYAALSHIDHHANNIMTIEDPVEYKISGYVQTEVNPRLGLTFANALRSVLRQDPDVIMVGEMRDRETALIAIQAALTGHTVFSTVHTNNAPATITRLVDMGIEPYLIASTVTAVLAQRLVRKICTQCKTEGPADRALLKEMGVTDKEMAGWKHIARGAGCTACKQTGYAGRQGIYELLVISDPIKKLMLHSSESNAIRDAAHAEGMVSMRRNGIALVRAGVTTFEEVMSATRDE